MYEEFNDDEFNIGEFKFRKIHEKKGLRQFKVRFLLTGEEKDSDISYEDAANTLISNYKRVKSIKEENSSDEEYVKKIFLRELKGLKKHECNDVVKNEIVYKNKINGDVHDISDEDKKIYETEKFKVEVVLEYENRGKVIDIKVVKK